MELNERQQRVLRGEICPYCGRETELVNADKIYSRKGLGMVMSVFMNQDRIREKLKAGLRGHH